MSQMVELPRNPVDFMIDALCPTARRRLTHWAYDNQRPRAMTFKRLDDALNELIEQKLVHYIGGLEDESGIQVKWILEPTFDGWQAIERLRCGIYEHHKAIYAAREARDIAMQDNPLWSAF